MKQSHDFDQMNGFGFGFKGKWIDIMSFLQLDT